MKNATALPLFAITAAAAFGLGWVIRPDTNGADGDPAAAAVGTRVTTSGGREANGGSRGQSGVSTQEGRFLERYLVDGKISAEDMRAAIKEMSETNDPLLKQKMLALLIENLTPENAKEAFLALRENGGGGPFGRGNRDELRLLANAWGRIDGEGAVAALKEIAEAGGEEEGRGRGGRGGRGGTEMASVLAGWATVDGAGAVAYLDGIDDANEKRMASFGVVQGMLVNGVSEAMSFIQSLPSSEGGDRSKGMFMAMVTNEMLEQGLESAKSWADTVTDSDLRTGVLARVTMEMMEDDRDGAAAWLVQFGDEEASAPAVSRLADSWSREDPQAVLEWAEQLSGQSKAEAYEEAIGSWASEDPTAAGAFLETLAASPERDVAVGEYATRVSRQDPETAMAWVDTIADAEVQQEAKVEVARDWYRQDQAAAQTWIDSSGLSEEEVNSVTAPPGERGGRRGGGFGR